jgi:hypothetical protein
VTKDQEKSKEAAKHFGSWLMSYMMEHKLQGKQISDCTGFHANVVQNWKSGRCQPNGYSVAVLATGLSHLTHEPRAEILDKMATALMWA